MAKQKAQKLPRINEAADVAKLGWVGNHAADIHRFAAVERFIWTLVGEDTPFARRYAALRGGRKHEWAEAKLALYLMNKHGMGISGRVTKKDVEAFIYDSERG